MGGWENGRYGGGEASWPGALIPLGSEEGVGVESGPVSTRELHPVPFILSPPWSHFLHPSILSLTAFPHSSDKMAGRAKEDEGGNAEVTAVACWVKPSTEALISVSLSFMCTRQNPFVSHLLHWFGPDRSGWAVEELWQSDGGEDEGKQRQRDRGTERHKYFSLLVVWPSITCRQNSNEDERASHGVDFRKTYLLTRFDVHNQMISTLLGNL